MDWKAKEIQILGILVFEMERSTEDEEDNSDIYYIFTHAPCPTSPAHNLPLESKLNLQGLRSPYALIVLIIEVE